MKFPTSAAISTTTGVLFGEIGGVYDVTSWLIGRDAYTHELAFYGRAAAAALRARRPELPDRAAVAHVTHENWREELARWERRLGAEVDLPDDLAGSLADNENMFTTLQKMISGDRA